MRAAQAFGLFVCFILIDWEIPSECSLSPHSQQPVEMSDPQTACTEKKWSTCTDDDWGPKCPSGCRLQGLIHVKNQQNNERVQEIGLMLENYSRMFGSTHITVTEALNRIRQSLDRLGNFGHTYYQLVDRVNSRFTTLQNRINFQNIKLRLLRKRILEQFRSIKILEVDIDIKMQSCKGSCIQSVVYNIDNEHNAQMEKSLNSMTGMRLDRIVYNKPMHNLSLVKKVDAVTGFKSASHINFKYPKFWEETHMELFVLDNIPHDSSSASSETITGSTSNGIDVHTGSMASGDIASIPGGINNTKSADAPLNYATNSTKNSDPSLSHVNAETSSKDLYLTKIEDAPLNDGTNSTRNSNLSLPHVNAETCSEELHLTKIKDAPLNYRMNITRNSNPSLSRVNAETSSKELYLTKTSVKGTLSDSSHYPKIFHSKTGSQSDMKQNFTNNTDSKIVNTFSDSSLLQGSKIFPGNSTYIETGSTSNFNEYSNSQDVDNSDVIDYKKHIISSTESMTELKNNVSYIETPNSNHQSKLEKDSNTMHPSVNSSLFPEIEITKFVPGDNIHNLNMEKMHKIKNYIGKDCDDIMQKHAKGGEDGLFRIKPPGCVEVMTVYCDQSTGLGGWMLVQQRMNESVNFNQSWGEYKRGFGSLDDQGQGNIWLGNDALHFLTQKETFLRIELEDWSGNKAYAEYIVNIGSESENYMLNITSYVGDAGDALITGLPVDQEHTSHANMKFSTFDRDNDKWEENCAQFYGGGWWYNNCQAANLNGIYYHGGLYDPRDNMPYEIENGIVWDPFKGTDYSLKMVRMKIRPIT